jgi:alpha-galactosidase
MEFLDLSELPRISFRYDGQELATPVPGWTSTTRTENASSGRTEVRTYRDPATELVLTIRVRRFDKVPALEWVAEFENAGAVNTPVVEDIRALDVALSLAERELLRLHHANGSACRIDDFLPITTSLPLSSQKVLTPEGGRSSNGVLPFMNLQREGCGMVLAIGWSGQWTARFERKDNSLRIAAGVERTHLALKPGEKIRTPRILVILWEGDDASRGNNLLRRLLLEHYLPRLNGELVMPPAAQCLQAYYYLTGKASAEFEMTALPKVAATGAEAYWIDACWYGVGQEWWQEVGSWVVNRDRFPDGLKPISDAAHKAGMKFVLWFEPERVRPGSLIHKEHPEFLLASERNPDNLLLNLGMPEAREYITDLVSGLITECGVDIYRQDFNFDPLPYWQAADAPDRIGMTEIKYVEGLYAFWDELRRRHPNIWIDNCSSGGRRIDLEMMSRSLPLWPSDFPDVCGLPFGLGLHVGDQCINAGLARWVPLFGGGVWNFTPYATRGEIIGGFTFGFHIEHADFPADNREDVTASNDVLARGKTLLDNGFPLAQVRAAVEEWKSVRPFFLGDFYLLLPLTVSYHDWCAWQLHREDMEAGVAVFFRRHRSPFPTMEVSMECVVPEAEYDVSLSPAYDEAPRQRMSGEDLTAILITIPDAPGSLLLRYSRVR